MYTASRSSGWQYQTARPCPAAVTATMPAPTACASAGSMSPSAMAASMSASASSPTTARASSSRRAGGSRPDSRDRSAAVSRTGRRPDRSPPPSDSMRATSRTYSGFPAVRCHTSSATAAPAALVASRNVATSGAVRPGITSSRAAGWRSVSTRRDSTSVPGAGARLAATTASGRWSSTAARNSSIRRDDGSAAWRSSTPISSGRSTAESASACTIRSAISKRLRATCSGAWSGSRSSVGLRARRSHSWSSARTPTRRRRRRIWVQGQYGGASVGSWWARPSAVTPPRSVAIRAISPRSAVLPMPGSPTSTTRPPCERPAPSRASTRTLSSRSRPSRSPTSTAKLLSSQRLPA